MHIFQMNLQRYSLDKKYGDKGSKIKDLILMNLEDYAMEVNTPVDLAAFTEVDSRGTETGFIGLEYLGDELRVPKDDNGNRYYIISQTGRTSEHNSTESVALILNGNAVIVECYQDYAYYRYQDLKVEWKKNQIPLFVQEYDEEKERVITKDSRLIFQEYPKNQEIGIRNLLIVEFYLNDEFYTVAMVHNRYTDTHSKGKILGDKKAMLSREKELLKDKSGDFFIMGGDFNVNTAIDARGGRYKEGTNRTGCIYQYASEEPTTKKNWFDYYQSSKNLNPTQNDNKNKCHLTTYPAESKYGSDHKGIGIIFPNDPPT